MRQSVSQPIDDWPFLRVLWVVEIVDARRL